MPDETEQLSSTLEAKTATEPILAFYCITACFGYSIIDRSQSNRTIGKHSWLRSDIMPYLIPEVHSGINNLT